MLHRPHKDLQRPCTDHTQHSQATKHRPCTGHAQTAQVVHAPCTHTTRQAAARQHASAVEANLRAGQWGDHGLPAHRAVPPPSLDQHFRQQLERHAANYRRRFAEFFRLVSQHASLDLAFLSFRLDFNLFYETSQLHAEAAAADLGPDASPQPGSPMPATP